VSDGRLEHAIGIVFRTGIAVSTVCLAAGLLLTFTGVDPSLSSILLQAGLLVLLGTPATRVLVSVVEYVIERDWTFAVLTTIVLIELLASVVAAMSG
jgi:uncharacterized membrane protein